jgi:hypothetical protein
MDFGKATLRVKQYRGLPTDKLPHKRRDEQKAYLESISDLQLSVWYIVNMIKSKD